MSVFESLMQQIRANNAPQAQLINSANQQADMMANMPRSDPMHAFNANFGMGVLAAPPEMGTLQAIGQAFPGAMSAMRETEQMNEQRQQQSMQMRKIAADTIEAVDKYNFEKQVNLRKLQHSDAMLAEDRHKTDEMIRHHMSSEDIALLGAKAKMMKNAQAGDLDHKAQEKKAEDTLKNAADFTDNFEKLKKIHAIATGTSLLGKYVGNDSPAYQLNQQLPANFRVKLSGDIRNNVLESALGVFLDNEYKKYYKGGIKEGFTVDEINKTWDEEVLKDPSVMKSYKAQVRAEFNPKKKKPKQEE